MDKAHLYAAADRLAAPGGGGSVDFNSDGIIDYVVTNIVPLIVCVIGLGILFLYKRGNLSDVGSRIGIMLLGLAVIAGGALWFAFAETILDVAVQ